MIPIWGGVFHWSGLRFSNLKWNSGNLVSKGGEHDVDYVICQQISTYRASIIYPTHLMVWKGVFDYSMVSSSQCKQWLQKHKGYVSFTKYDYTKHVHCISIKPLLANKKQTTTTQNKNRIVTKVTTLSHGAVWIHVKRNTYIYIQASGMEYGIYLSITRCQKCGSGK